MRRWAASVYPQPPPHNTDLRFITQTMQLYTDIFNGTKYILGYCRYTINTSTLQLAYKQLCLLLEVSSPIIKQSEARALSSSRSLEYLPEGEH